MPKEKALKNARRNFFANKGASSSEESLASTDSGEYSHIAIPEDEINDLISLSNNLTTEITMDQISAQLEHLTQQLAALNARQVAQDSEVNLLRTASRVNVTSGNDNGMLQLLSRIPDPIKGIPTFDGNKRQLHAWLTTTETTLTRFRPLVTDAVFEIYVQAILNKIEGRAKDILCLAGNPSSFDEIKTILIEALGDRQELSTYKARLWANKQTHDMSIKHYYNKTKEMVQNIKTISKQDPLFNAHWEAISKFIEQDALAAFMAGLKTPYQGYAQASGPKDLEDAYAFLCKFQSTEKIAEVHRPHNSNKNFKDSGFAGKRESSYSQQKPNIPPPKAEPMETRTTRSRLTINNFVTKPEENPPTVPNSDSEPEDDVDLDLNFHLVDIHAKTT